MVMDVVGSYGDWRQPRTPSQQAPPSLASTREQSPVSAADVNFNSPGHRSSQDGSFIQDEDMQLILEFGAKRAVTPNKAGGGAQNVGVLSESWMHRHAKWATDFDANVAELDFDHFSRRDIRTLRKAAAAYQLGKNILDEDADMTWDSFTTTANDSAPPVVGNQNVPSADCNHNKIRTAPPCNSLDASLAVSAASLFSSAGGAGCNGDLLPSAVEQQVAVLLNNPLASVPAFISTDSLDLSSMAGQEELIRQACTTKKRDYMLTFDRGGGVTESGVGGSDDTDYRDAGLSNAVERSLLNNGYNAVGTIDESVSSRNDENGCNNSTFVSFGRVKRSYEIDRQPSYEAYNAKFTSLPDLDNCTSNYGAESIECIGGGERMLSGEGEQCVPIFQLKQSFMAPDASMMESMNDFEANTSLGEGTERFSLLKAFKSKLSGGAVEKLPLPQLRHGAAVGNHSSGDSSGYVTGTGSQQGCGAGAKPKMLPKANAGECDLRTDHSSSTISKDEQQTSNLEHHVAHVDGYRYAEFFINGRYIDINHNEIGFVPPSTRGVQRASSSQQQFFIDSKQNDEETELVTTPPPPLTSFHQQAVKVAIKHRNSSSNTSAPAKPPRTFATLLKEQEDDRDNANNGSYLLQQRPERAPYGRRILPKIPDESQLNATEVSRMKDSATQVPVYVVDQSVQTTSTDNSEQSLIVVTTCVTKSNVGEPFYVGSGSRTGPATTSSPKSTDWRKMFFGGSSSQFVNVPDLNFLKFPFNVPQLFPHVPPFPLAFLNDGPDVTSFVTQQAKLINAAENQLAPPRRVLPSPPPPSFASSKYQAATALNQQQLQPLFAQMKTPDCESTTPAATCSSATGVRRDSGLGVSGGPSHIQDWESLATLLPKDVLQAYSFFKANSDLLGKSTPLFRPDLNIDKRSAPRESKCCSCASGRRSCGKRGTLLVASSQNKRRLGRKQRHLSEPAFKRKQFESIVEEQEKMCDGVSNMSSSQRPCRCCDDNFRHCHHLHRYHLAEWCCVRSPSTIPPRCSPMQCENRHQRSSCQRRCAGHVCAGDTDDTEEEGTENLDTHQYRPLNSVARKMGGVCSDDERLMPSPSSKRQGQYIMCSDDEDYDDDEDDEICIPPSPLRGTHSEYHVRDTVTRNAYVPKFFSVQNVQEISQFGPIGYPLKKLRPTQLTGAANESARPCATCYRVRSPSNDLTESGSLVIVMEEQSANERETADFCDCKTSDILEELRSRKGWSNSHGSIDKGKGGRCVNCNETSMKNKASKQVAEHAAVAYQQKRGLVQGVVAACNNIMQHLGDCHREELWQTVSTENLKAASAAIRYSLCPTVERLVADGLLQGKTVWTVVMASATLGPATKSIYELVTDLDKSVGDNGEHSLLFVAFITGLLRLRSLDCWLSYLSLKDRVLIENYKESSFFRKAATTYRTLFNEILSAIQPLSLLPFDQLQLNPLIISYRPSAFNMLGTNTDEYGSADDFAMGAAAGLSSTVSLHKEIVITFQRPYDGTGDTASSLPANVGMETSIGGGVRYSLIPSRLPSDSRVPKSSSVPSKMVRHASEPPKSTSVDTGLKSGVVVNISAFKRSGIPSIKSMTRTRRTERDMKVSSTHPSRIPVLKSSRSCPEGPRQRSLSNRRISQRGAAAAYIQSEESESAMSVTASTFSEMDALDSNFCSDSDYRSADARYVYAIDEEQGDRDKDLLTFTKGDTMILLEDTEDGLLRCQRGNEIGLVPRKKVTYVTFL